MSSSKSPAKTSNKKIPPNEREFAVRGEDERWEALVYERVKKGAEGSLPNLPGKVQGVWKDSTNVELSPCVMWMYPSVPKDVAQLRDVYGVWGFHPDITPPTDITTLSPEHIWFYGPKTKPPSHFTPRGIWTFPLVKRDISVLADHEAGFLNIGTHDKVDEMGVSGTWRLLYKKDGPDVGEGQDASASRSANPRQSPMKINVETPEGKVLIFEVDPMDTIDSVKEKVQQSEKIPKMDQKLTFGGLELDNPKTLEDYNVKSGDTLKLIDTMRIYVRHYDGVRKFTLDVVPTNTVDDIKRKIESEKGIPRKEQRLSFQKKPLEDSSSTLRENQIVNKSVLDLDPMTVYVRTPEGKRHTFEVEPTDKIQDVKKRIESKLKTPVKDQKLTFRGQPVEDKRSLDDSGIQHGDVLDLNLGMQIIVKHWDNATFSLDVDPKDSIDDIKNQIQRVSNIPKRQQRLWFKNGPLKDPAATLTQAGIKHNDVVELLPMQINVRTPEGKVVPMIVKPTDSIKSLKRKIADKEGIPVPDQRLSFANTPLDEDTKTLDDIGIHHGDTVNLEGMKINVLDWNGTINTYDVKPSDTLENVMDQVQKRQGIPKDQQRMLHKDRPLKDKRKTLNQYGIMNNDSIELLPCQIFVKTPEGKTLPLIVSPNDTIQDIKKKVKDKTGIPVEDQRLNYDGKPLDDDRATLDDVGIKHGDTVNMEGMEIHVKDLNGKVSTYSVTPTDTIDSVKDQVAKRLGIPKNQQRLSHGSRPLQDDSKTLKQCNVKHNDTLELLPWEITVKTPEGKSVPVVVTPNDTIKDIKKKVKDKTGIPVEDQRLNYDGKPLDDDRATLDDVGIKHGDTVNMEGMEIHVKDLNGKVSTYSVTPTDTIDTVKDQVAKRLGIPKNQQRLSHGSRPLKDDSKTLKQCNVKHNDTLELLPWEITVKTPEGKSVPVVVTPNDTIKDIKKKVKDKTGIPVENQRLNYDGKPLDDDRATVDDVGIKHGDTVTMEGMEIHVKDLNGKVSTYSVTPNDTIDSVKDQVAKRLGIPKNQQRLSHGSRPLKDDSKTLKQCNVKHNDTLELLPWEITVKTPEGKSVPVVVTPNDTIKDIKKKVKDKTGIPVEDQRLNYDGKPLDDDRATLDDVGIKHGDTVNMEGMEIHVKDLDGKVSTYSVTPTDTIDSVKDQVAKRLGIPKNQQRLSHGSRPLKDDSKTLKQCNVKHNDTLELLPWEITVKTPEGKSVPVVVTPNDTIKDIKKKVKDKTGIPVEDQRLNYDGKPLDDDRATLDDVGIKHGDTVNMEGMEIHVKDLDGKVSTYSVTPTDTIDSVKDQVAKRLGIPKNQQRLSHGSRPLKDDSKTLKQCNVKHNDTLELLPWEITVKTPEGKSVPVVVTPNDTIKDIKKKVKDKTGIPVEDQRLNYDGKPLDDDRATVDDVGIKHGDTVNMEGMEIHVKDLDGKVSTYSVTPTDTIDSVKDQVAKRLGIPKNGQRLSHGSRPLKDDSKTLKQCNVKHNDTLELLPWEITVKTPEGKSVPVVVTPNDTIKDIKKKVKDKTGIPVEDQRLNYDGKPLDDDRATLDDVGIKHGDTVNMEGMEIHVKDLDGKVSTYSVTPTDTIDSVKDQVAKRLGIPKNQQRLSHGSRPLKDDSKTLKQCNVKHNDTLELLPWEITVKTPEGKSVPVVVTPNDTIKDIKKKVKDKTGIPVEDQRLNYDGKPLDDDRATVDDVGIKHGDTVNMEGMEIHVKDLDGKVSTYSVTPTDTIDSVKDQVAKRLGIPKNGQRLSHGSRPLKDDSKTLKQCNVKHNDTLELLPWEITVKTPEGKSVPVVVTPNDTIKDIKKKVKDKTGIPVEDQRLNYDGKPLDDDRATVDDVGIKHGDAVNMEGMEIHVKDLDGKVSTYSVTPSDTIDSVKDQVAKRLGIPKNQQRLSHGSRPLKDDSKTLKQCNVKHNDTLELLPWEITVKTPEGKSVPVVVTPNDTIKDIKKKVKDKTGIPVEDQRLNYDGKPLDDDRATVDDVGIKHGDTVNMDGMQIFVRDPKGKVYPLTVDPSDTLEKIKNDLETTYDIPKKNQRLFFKDTPLDNDKDTLRQCKIQHNDTLDLGPMEIHAKLPNGEKITLDVEPTDTTLDIKKRIEEISKIPAKDQIISFNGRPLGDQSTLDESGVEHGDLVHVKQRAPPVRKTEASSPKKSYLPADWKKEQDRYGEVITTYYEIDHNVDEDENFIRGTAEEREKFKFEKAKRKSEKM